MRANQELRHPSTLKSVPGGCGACSAADTRSLGRSIRNVPVEELSAMQTPRVLIVRQGTESRGGIDGTVRTLLSNARSAPNYARRGCATRQLNTGLCRLS